MLIYVVFRKTIPLYKLNYTFKICLSEICCSDQKSVPQLQNYQFVHQGRQQNKKGGGVLIFVYNSLNFKVRNDRNDQNKCTERC